MNIKFTKFQKKDEPFSLKIPKIIDCKGSGCLNV